MDKFHVGQRVRYTGIDAPDTATMWNGLPVPLISRGEHGTVTGRGRRHWYVLFDVTKSPHPSGEYSCHSYQIEPIPDDAAFHRFMAHTLEPMKETT